MCPSPTRMLPGVWRRFEVIPLRCALPPPFGRRRRVRRGVSGQTRRASGGDCRFQAVGQIGLFPAEATVRIRRTAEVPIGRRALIDRTVEAQMGPDPARREAHGVTDGLLDLGGIDLRRTMSVDIDRQRLRHANGIAELDRAALRQTRSADVLGQIPRRIGGRPAEPAISRPAVCRADHRPSRKGVRRPGAKRAPGAKFGPAAANEDLRYAPISRVSAITASIVSTPSMLSRSGRWSRSRARRPASSVPSSRSNSQDRFCWACSRR